MIEELASSPSKSSGFLYFGRRVVDPPFLLFPTALIGRRRTPLLTATPRPDFSGWIPSLRQSPHKGIGIFLLNLLGHRGRVLPGQVTLFSLGMGTLLLSFPTGPIFPYLPPPLSVQGKDSFFADEFLFLRGPLHRTNRPSASLHDGRRISLGISSFRSRKIHTLLFSPPSLRVM